METHNTEAYEKPVVKDLGTLQELTAACTTTAGTDNFHGVSGFLTNAITSAGFCHTS